MKVSYRYNCPLGTVNSYHLLPEFDFWERVAQNLSITMRNLVCHLISYYRILQIVISLFYIYAGTWPKNFISDRNYIYGGLYIWRYTTVGVVVTCEGVIPGVPSHFGRVVDKVELRHAPPLPGLLGVIVQQVPYKRIGQRGNHVGCCRHRFFLGCKIKMTTEKQRAAARRNIKKARAKWKRMSKQSRAKAMPGRRRRRKKR